MIRSARGVITVLLLFQSVFNYAQTGDVLAGGRAPASDIDKKIDMLDSVCWLLYQQKSLHELIRQARESIAVAEQNGLQHKAVNAYAYLGLSNYEQENYANALQYLLKSRSLWSIQTPQVLREDALRALTNIYYMGQRFSECLPYAHELLALRKQKGDSILVAYTTSFIGDALLQQNKRNEALRYWEDALQTLRAMPPPADTLVLSLSDKIGRLHGLRGEHVKSLFHYSTALQDAVTFRLKPSQAYFSFHVSLLHYALANYDSAYVYARKALELYEQQKDVVNVINTLNCISVVRRAQAMYEDAVVYGLKALELAGEVNSDLLTARLLNDLTSTYQASGETDKAFEYLYASKTIFEHNKAGVPLAAVYGNIGAMHAFTRQYDSALFWLNRALQILRRKGNNIVAANVYQNLGETYCGLSRLPEALAATKTALDLSAAAKDSLAFFKCKQSLGHIYLVMAKDANHTKQLKMAEAELRSAAEFFLRKKIPDNLYDTYHYLSQVYQQQGRYGEALQSYRNYTFYKDSVLNIAVARQVVQQRADGEHRIELAKKEKIAALARQEARFRFNLAILIGAIILAITIAAFFIRQKLKEKDHHLSLAAIRQEALNAQMSDHFIFNTMDSIGRLMKANDIPAASKYLQTFSKLVRKVLENSGERFITLQDDLNILQSYIELEKLRFPNDGLQYSIELDEHIIPSEVLVPPMVTQVIVENALKHGFSKLKGGQLQISIRKKDDAIAFEVRDNGLGRQQQSQEHSESKRSIGGSLAQRLIQSADKTGRHSFYSITDLVDEEQNAAGTLVKFRLPYIPLE